MTEAAQIIRDPHRGMSRLANVLSILSHRFRAPVAQPCTELLGAMFDYVTQHIEPMHRPIARAHRHRAKRMPDTQSGVFADACEHENAANPTPSRALRERLDRLKKASRGTLGTFCTLLKSHTKLMQQRIVREWALLFAATRSARSDTQWEQLNAATETEQDSASRAAAHRQLGALISQIDESTPMRTEPQLQPAAKVSAPSDTTLLEIRGLYSHYGRIAALHGASLTVRTGRLVALVGANGAGKTTLLRTISGVQKATGGSIFFDGRDITKLRADKRVRLGICQVPEGRQVFGPLSVADNLRLGAFTGNDEKYIAKDLRRMYETFPILHEKAHEPAGTLSGGQQQMLAIARALMGQPRLLLLDEPSMGLAPLLVEEIFRTIENLRRQSITILLVEQNAQAALAIADDAYVMEMGKIVIAGSGRELLADERVREAYLGV